MLSYLPSIRTPYIQQEGVESVIELLQQNGLEVIRQHEDEALNLVELRSVMSGVHAALTLANHTEIDDVGCAYFTGPDRAELAMGFATALSYLPAEILHLDARTAAEANQRTSALRVLGQFYMMDEVASYWTGESRTTIRLAAQDTDKSVRYGAAQAELLGCPAEAREHIREMMEREPDERTRQQLEAMLRLAEERAPSGQVAAVPEEKPDGLRLAFPSLWLQPLDDLVEGLEPVCTLESTRTPEVDPDVSLASFRIRGTADASLHYLLHQRARLGCAYFQGKDAALLAVVASPALNLLPVDIARAVAHSGRNPELRSVALYAIALAASEKILPGHGVAPETRAALRAGLEDDDPRIKEVALRASLLIRDELDRTVTPASSS